MLNSPPHNRQPQRRNLTHQQRVSRFGVGLRTAVEIRYMEKLIVETTTALVPVLSAHEMCGPTAFFFDALIFVLLLSSCPTPSLETAHAQILAVVNLVVDWIFWVRQIRETARKGKGQMIRLPRGKNAFLLSRMRAPPSEPSANALPMKIPNPLRCGAQEPPPQYLVHPPFLTVLSQRQDERLVPLDGVLEGPQFRKRLFLLFLAGSQALWQRVRMSAVISRR